MKRPAATSARKIGRPLSFERDAALEQAMLLFWRHGYEATSMSALTKAMGVTPPSVYAAFGDKKGLFLQAVARYLAGPRTPSEIIRDASSSREAARGLIEGAVVAFTRPDAPPGCLLASSAIACSAEAADVRDALAAIRLDVEASLHARIARGVAEGELTADTDIDGLAAFVTAVIQGMSTLARDGAPREKLARVAARAMTAWPD